MESTIEVRWFLAGPTPNDVSHWFHLTDPQVSPLEEREDWYLRLPHQTDLGIKLRQGRLEVKQRVQDHHLQPLSAKICGHVERWQKWSFRLHPDDPESAHLPLSQGQWIAVQKTRLLKTFEVTDDLSVQPAAVDQSVSQGCELEIAQIQALGQGWFSLGFEAFGSEDRLEANLWQTLKQVLPQDRFACLKADHALSYPKWLAAIGLRSE